MIFVSLDIAYYKGVNLTDWFKIWGEAHLQVHYKASVTWVMNNVLECNVRKNNSFLTNVKSNAHVYPQTWDNFLP
jgi:hypothetical protein